MIRVSYAYHTRIIRVSYAYHTCIIRVSYAYHTRIIRVSYAYHTRIIRVSYVKIYASGTVCLISDSTKTIKLLALDLYEIIVDSGFALIKYHLI